MSQLGLWDTGEPSCAVAYGRRLLDVAIRRYKPVAVFGMFSGGHDSLCATHYAAQHPSFTAAVHINTGIGVERTRDFVRSTSLRQGWPLLELRAEDMGQYYDELVIKHGFPGPFHHRKMYNRLKQRALRALVRDHKLARSDKVLLVTGVRRNESVRRMGTARAINTEGAQVWCAPIFWFSQMDKNAYMDDHGLPRNEVVDLLHQSGECLCGAFAKPGELDWLSMCGFHDEVSRIRTLEVKAAAAGVPAQWGVRPSSEPTSSGFLCVGCGGT